MSDIVKLISDNLMQILFTVITGIIGYIGLRIKNTYQNYVEHRIKKEIIQKVVIYIEQTKTNLSCEDKKKEALELSMSWLKEKKISVSDIELEILIESAVKCI